MNPEFETYELIDRYLNKQLSGGELEAFGNRMLTDQEFSELVDAQRMANELIISEQLIGLKQRMKSDLDAGKDKSGFSKGMLGLLLIGAIGAGAGAYLYNSESKSNTEKVTTESAVKQVFVAEQGEKSSVKTVNPVSDEPRSVKVSEKEIVKEGIKNSEPITTTELPVAKIDEEKKVQLSSVNKAVVVNHQVVPVVEKPKETVKVKSVEPEAVVNHKETKVAQETEAAAVKPQKVDEVFMPVHGEVWRVPLNSSATATIRFFNKAGAIVKEVHVPSGEVFEWDGKGNHGEDLDTGRYLFVAEYADGKQQKGYISLIR